MTFEQFEEMIIEAEEWGSCEDYLTALREIKSIDEWMCHESLQELCVRCAAFVLEGRFELGEKAISTSAKASYDYARGVLEGRFEAGEKAILTSSEYSYLYALNVIKGRFEAGEKAISTSYEYSYLYAKDVVKGRFEAGEKAIAGNPKYSYLYSKDALKGRFEADEYAFLGRPDYFYLYARDVVKGPVPAGEEAIIGDVDYSYLYALNVVKGRFEAGEKAISESPRDSYLYAKDVVKGRFEAGEKAISKSARSSYLYALHVLKGPFKRGEKAFVDNVEYYHLYREFLSTLAELDQMGISLETLVGSAPRRGRPKKYERRKPSPARVARPSTIVKRSKGNRPISEIDMNVHKNFKVRTGNELAAARKILGLDLAGMALSIGVMRKNRQQLQVRMKQLEVMDKVPLHYGLLAECLLQGFEPSTLQDD